MKVIPLTQGKHTRVDDADYAALSQFKWNASQRKMTWYAVRNEPYGPVIDNRGRRKNYKVLMHRQILGLGRGERGDHRNNDGLDNQRHNLRRCTAQQNGFNRQKSRGCSSRFKGVCWCKQHEQWVSYIGDSNKNPKIRRRHLGLFDSEVAAARAYDSAANELFGQFAYLNFP